jgi:hypothetical protein
MFTPFFIASLQRLRIGFAILASCHVAMRASGSALPKKQATHAKQASFLAVIRQRHHSCDEPPQRGVVERPTEGAGGRLICLEGYQPRPTETARVFGWVLSSPTKTDL